MSGRFHINGSDFYDKSRYEEIAEHRNRLPHRNLSGVIQFVTFRLADSIPAEVLESIDREKKAFLQCAGNKSTWKRDKWTQYNRINESLEKFMDAGMGKCPFAEARCRKILTDMLHEYDGELYDLFAYVVMPNHVHMLIRQLMDIEYIMEVVKGSSSNLLGDVSAGFKWQREYWDTMVRSQESFRQKLRYINRNPAHLPPGTFTLYQNPHIIFS